MRRALLPAALLTAALALAACTASAEPGWTYAPATPEPSASAAPSGEPSAEPSASAEPSVAPSASAEPSGSAPAGDVVDVSAVNIQFEQSSLDVPADTPFTIRFENKDAGIPHNVEIKDGSGASVFLGEIFNGVETRDYQVPALAAGEYTFICTVHPNMTGTLTAG